MTGSRVGHLAIALALVATAILVGVELQRGALAADPMAVPNPCTRTVQVTTGGIDGEAQRVGLGALDAAACRLGTTREQLLLSVASSLASSGTLPGGTESAIRDGLQKAIDAEQRAGHIGTIEAFLLSQAAQRAPVEWVVQVVQRVGPLVG